MTSLVLNGRYYRLYPPERFLGQTEKLLELDTATTALLAVDVYGPGFLAEASEDDTARYQSMNLKDSFEIKRDIVVNYIGSALAAARQVGLPIVYANNSAPRIGIHQSELGKVSQRCGELDWETWGVEKDVDPLK